LNADLGLIAGAVFEVKSIQALSQRDGTSHREM